MGDWLQVTLHVDLEGLDEVAVGVLEYLAGSKPEPPHSLPSHPLFSDPDSEWRSLGRSRSAYHQGASGAWFVRVERVSEDFGGAFTLVTQHKYQWTLRALLDWLRQYFTGGTRTPTYIGTWRWDQAELPDLLFAQEPNRVLVLSQACRELSAVEPELCPFDFSVVREES